MNKPFADPIVPQFWMNTQALPESQFQINAGGILTEDDLQPGSLFADRIRHTFHNVGLVYVVNTGLTELEPMRRVAQLARGGTMKYEAGANPRSSLAPSVFEVGAPLTAALHMHHEMAYVEKSTASLAFLCRKAPRTPGKGATYASDNLQATDYILSTELGQKLKVRDLRA